MSAPAPAGTTRRRAGRLVAWTLPAVRLAMIALVVVLAALEPGTSDTATWVAGLVIVAAAGTAPGLPRYLVWPMLIVEMLVVAFGAPRTGGADSPLLPYVAATALTAGTRLGPAGGLLVAVAGGLAFVVGRLTYEGGAADSLRFSFAAAQWFVVACMVALGSGALRAGARGAPSVDERYAEAYRLIGQLRAVSRRLPGSLDPGTVADTLLDRAAAVATFRRGAVLLAADGRLVPLALRGTRRLPWRVAHGEPGPVRDALDRGVPVVDRRQADADGGRRRRANTLVAVPVLAGDRTVGALVLDSDDQQFPDDQVRRLAELARETGLPLETARLFEDLRSAAADEERSRLAHEMHDGIAQDLAHLGYELDALTTRIRSGATDVALADAQQLRRRITDLVGDLRLSISDLRSSIGPSRGLGLALSEYARSVGTTTGVTVHLSLNEGVTRLPAEVETQLLRIAHEAIGAARRGRALPDGHRVRPRNLWVILLVDPPTATLVVEDDGPSTVDPATFDVIRERAASIGARADAGLRVPSGVRVRVDVEGGAGWRRGSSSPTTTS